MTKANPYHPANCQHCAQATEKITAARGSWSRAKQEKIARLMNDGRTTVAEVNQAARED